MLSGARGKPLPLGLLSDSGWFLILVVQQKGSLRLKVPFGVDEMPFAKIEIKSLTSPHAIQEVFRMGISALVA